jgi:hypothetical protein
MGDTALACFGRIPWINSQGARQARRQRATMSMVTATAKTTMPTTMMAAMATTTMDKWNTTAVTTDDDVNIDVVEDNDNDGTTTMRWRQGRMDDDDAMAMGGQRHA